MMGKFKKYENYRNSGFGWIGEIPSDWEMIRTKFLFSERVQKGFPEKPLLAATQTQGVVKKEDYGTRTVTAQKDFHLLKLVKVGDFVISLRSFQGGIEISYEEGIISPAYTIMIPSTKVEKNYVKHLFKSKFFILSLNRFVTGIREGQNIDYKKFKNSFLPVPPFQLQKPIANFLDEKTKQIDNFIKTKEKTIALLQERKAAIINQVVTKGLDPNVPMKHSGIEWLGEIPAHWEVKKLKYVSKIKTGEKDTINKEVDGIHPFYVRSDNIEKISTYSFDGEAVLTAGDGAGVAKVFHYVNGKFDYHQRVYKISNFKEILGRFFFFYMKYNFIKEVMKISAKTTVDSLRLPMLLNFSVTISKKSEQLKIVEFILKIESKINLIIKNIQKEITLIKEYRASLISAAVTGKIDVSGYQAKGTKAQTASAELANSE